jgi:hypothetical protein
MFSSSWEVLDFVEFCSLNLCHVSFWIVVCASETRKDPRTCSSVRWESVDDTWTICELLIHRESVVICEWKGYGGLSSCIHSREMVL